MKQSLCLALLLIAASSFTATAQVPGTAVGCGCYCGKMVPPPCSEAACKTACGWPGGSSSSSSASSTLMQQAFTNFFSSLLQSNAEAAERRRQMMEELERRRIEAERLRLEAERQHRLEEARRLREMIERLSRTLKLTGLPDLQMKLSAFAGPLQLKFGDSNEDHVGIQNLPGIALNGGNVPYGIPGLPGIYTNGPSPDSGLSEPKLQLKMGDSAAAPPDAAVSPEPQPVPAAQAQAAALPDPRNMTPQQAADMAELVSNLPPEEQERLMAAARSTTNASSPGLPNTLPGQPPSPALTQLQQLAPASQSAAAAPVLEDASAQARAGFDTPIGAGATGPGAPAAATSSPSAVQRAPAVAAPDCSTPGTSDGSVDLRCARVLVVEPARVRGTAAQPEVRAPSAQVAPAQAVLPAPAMHAAPAQAPPAQWQAQAPPAPAAREGAPAMPGGLLPGKTVNAQGCLDSLRANQHPNGDTTLPQTLTYQGVTLQPGDVIDFHEGLMTLHLTQDRQFFAHGHTALYLGRDEKTGEALFLDFQFRSDTDQYHGLIRDEQTFLIENRKRHGSFDVFRLKDTSTLQRSVLVAEAEYIAANKRYLASGLVCSSAAIETLSKATGLRIEGWKPDDIASSSQFQRPPGLEGKTINMTVALRERRDRDLRQLEDAIRLEERAQESLECSEAALQLTQELNDTQAQGIAQGVAQTFPRGANAGAGMLTSERKSYCLKRKKRSRRTKGHCSGVIIP